MNLYSAFANTGKVSHILAENDNDAVQICQENKLTLLPGFTKEIAEKPEDILDIYKNIPNLKWPLYVCAIHWGWLHDKNIPDLFKEYKVGFVEFSDEFNKFYEEWNEEIF